MRSVDRLRRRSVDSERCSLREFMAVVPCELRATAAVLGIDNNDTENDRRDNWPQKIRHEGSLRSEHPRQRNIIFTYIIHLTTIQDTPAITAALK